MKSVLTAGELALYQGSFTLHPVLVLLLIFLVIFAYFLSLFMFYFFSSPKLQASSNIFNGDSGQGQGPAHIRGRQLALLYSFST